MYCNSVVQLQDLLIEEELRPEIESRPCLEYALQHDIFSCVASLARYPVWSTIAITFFRRTTEELDDDYLANELVAGSVLQLLQELQDSQEIVQLLYAISLRISKYPPLIAMFFHGTTWQENSQDGSDFALYHLFIKYMHSEEHGAYCRTGLLYILSAAGPSIFSWLTDSDLSTFACIGITSNYSLLGGHLNHKAYDQFILYLAYWQDILAMVDRELSAVMLQDLKRLFLQPVLYPSMLHSEDGAACSLYLGGIFDVIHDDRAIDAIAQYMFGRTKEEPLYFNLRDFVLENIQNSATVRLIGSLARHDTIRLILTTKSCIRPSISFGQHKKEMQVLASMTDDADYENYLADAIAILQTRQPDQYLMVAGCPIVEALIAHFDDFLEKDPQFNLILTQTITNMAMSKLSLSKWLLFDEDQSYLSRADEVVPEGQTTTIYDHRALPTWSRFPPLMAKFKHISAEIQTCTDIDADTGQNIYIFKEFMKELMSIVQIRRSLHEPCRAT